MTSAQESAETTLAPESPTQPTPTDAQTGASLVNASDPTAQTNEAITQNAASGHMPSASQIGLDTVGNACDGAGVSGFFGIPNDISTCLSYMAARVLYLIVWLVSWFLWIAGMIFDMVLQVQNSSFYNQPVVNVGWKIARDVVNIFYILILLIIAIATIIQNSSYGMKQILWKLIVSALLVNFSLPLAGLVIDFSNALGNTFYTQMSTSNTGEKSEISAVFVSGFQPQKFFNTETEPNTLLELGEKLLRILLIEISAIIAIGIISIMLLVISGMLVVRIVALWFVLILAPFAFLFWVLPKTSNLADKWFSALFDNSFFYPAYMFTLYVLIAAIKTNAIADMVNANNTGQGFFIETAILILNMVTLTLFALGGLLVAKQMSVQGAGIATMGGKYLTNKAKNTGARLGRVANAPMASASEKSLQSRAAQMISRIPIMNQALRAPGASAQKRAADRAKTAEEQAARAKHLDPRAAATMLLGMNIHGKMKAFDTMDEKRKARVVQAMSAEDQKQFAQKAQDTDPTKDYQRQIAIASGSIEQAMNILNPKDPPQKDEEKYQELVNKYTKGLSEKDLAKLREESINSNYFKKAAVVNKIDIEKLQDSADIIDPNARKAFGDLANEINGVTGALKILHGVDKPVDDATNEDKANYQKLSDAYMVHLDEKQISKLNKDVGNNQFVTNSMLKNFDTTDMRRYARNGDNADVIKQAIERATGHIGDSLEKLLDAIVSDADYAKIPDKEKPYYQKESAVSARYGINQNFLRVMRSGPARGLVIEGTPMSRRNIPPLATPPPTPAAPPPPTS